MLKHISLREDKNATCSCDGGMWLLTCAGVQKGWQEAIFHGSLHLDTFTANSVHDVDDGLVLKTPLRQTDHAQSEWNPHRSGMHAILALSQERGNRRYSGLRER